MYLVGKGTDVMGPGTSTVQRIGWDQAQESQSNGLGCACKGGLGLFDGGIDVSTWGPMEWAAVGVGGYMLTSIFFTGRRAVRQVREGVSSRVRRARRRVGSRIAGK